MLVAAAFEGCEYHADPAQGRIDNRYPKPRLPLLVSSNVTSANFFDRARL